MKGEVVIERGGLSTSSLLGLIFIVLKLCGVINWSWVWVLCPFWLGIALTGLFLSIWALLIFNTKTETEEVVVTHYTKRTNKEKFIDLPLEFTTHEVAELFNVKEKTARAYCNNWRKEGLCTLVSPRCYKKL